MGSQKSSSFLINHLFIYFDMNDPCGVFHILDTDKFIPLLIFLLIPRHDNELIWFIYNPLIGKTDIIFDIITKRYTYSFAGKKKNWLIHFRFNFLYKRADESNRFIKMFSIILVLLYVIPVTRMTSIHSAYKEEVHDVPMSVIMRPFMPELDEDKVKSLMETIQVMISLIIFTVSV